MAVGLTIELVVLVEDVKDGQNAKVSDHFVLNMESNCYPYSSADLEQF